MVSIVEVTTRQQLHRFVDFPNQLYKDVPQFVPATYGDDLDDWDRKKNPAFSYCEARCWLALREGEIVGRIGAILSRKSNSKWGTNRLRFTQVDFIDDPEVSVSVPATFKTMLRQFPKADEKAAKKPAEAPVKPAEAGNAEGEGSDASKPAEAATSPLAPADARPVFDNE